MTKEHVMSAAAATFAPYAVQVDPSDLELRDQFPGEVEAGDPQLSTRTVWTRADGRHGSDRSRSGRPVQGHQPGGPNAVVDALRH